MPILALTLSGCGSNDTGYATLTPSDSGATGGAQGVGGSSFENTITTGSIVMPSTTTGSIGLTGGGTSATTTGGGGGMPEVCDGVDNDGNGIVDDVDAGGDGMREQQSLGEQAHAPLMARGIHAKLH